MPAELLMSFPSNPATYSPIDSYGQTEVVSRDMRGALTLFSL